MSNIKDQIKKEKTSIQLPKVVYDLLKKDSDEANLSVSELVRIRLMHGLAKNNANILSENDQKNLYECYKNYLLNINEQSFSLYFKQVVMWGSDANNIHFRFVVDEVVKSFEKSYKESDLIFTLTEKKNLTELLYYFPQTVLDIVDKLQTDREISQKLSTSYENVSKEYEEICNFYNTINK